MQVMRFDIRNDSLRQTSQGYWMVTIAAARTGLQSYVDVSYKTGRRVEFRSLDAVTEDESLKSWQHAPITIYHPKDGFVDITNSALLKKGYVFECPWIEEGPDGESYVCVNVLLDHPDAIEGVRTKRLQEASAGYDCLFVKLEGVYKGQPYDGLQSQIRINHLALLPAGFARAGQYAAIRLDGDDRSYFYFQQGDMPMSDVKTVVRVRLDAATSVDLDQENAAIVETAIAAYAGRIDALEQEKGAIQADLETQKATASALEARADAAETANTALKAEFEAYRKDGAKTELKALANTYAKVAAFLPDDFRVDSLDEVNARVLYLAALKTLAPGVDFSARQDAYLEAYVDSASQNAPTPGTPSKEAQKLFDALEKPVAPTPEAPKPVNAYHDSLTKETRERGIN